MEVLYTAEATSSGGREGRVRTSDGVIELPLSMPNELGDLAVTLKGIERGEAEALANAAHEEICPYSRATRGNIDVAVSVV